MMTEFSNQSSASQVQYTRGLSARWRNNVQLYDPSVWLAREPEIEEKMLRDPDIAHAVAFRKEMIAGRQWSVVPAQKNHPLAALSVAIYTELLKSIKGFTASRESLARAFLSGSRYAKIHGEARKLRLGDGRERTWIVPTRIEDYDKRMFRPVPKYDQKSGKIETHLERWHVGKDKWEREDVEDGINTLRHVYQDDQSTLGHGRGLREALGWVWYSKTHIQQEWIQFLERTGQGFTEVKVDGLRDADTNLDNEEVQRQYAERVRNHLSRNVLVHDKNDEIVFSQVVGDGGGAFDKAMDRFEKWVLKLVLSANLPTSADKGGSYALADTQANSQEMRFQFDREHLEETLTDGLLGWIEYYNWPNIVELRLNEHKPKFSINQDEKLDPLVRSQVINTLHTSGVDLPLAEIYEQTGFRQPEQGEPVLAGATAPAPMDPFGGGFGGGLGDGKPTPVGDGKSAKFSSDIRHKKSGLFSSQRKIRLYRAANDDYISDTASFSVDIDTAKAYRDNPGYGGERLFMSLIRADEGVILDLHSIGHSEARDKMVEIIGYDPGAIGIDEQVPRSGGKFSDAGYDWVIVTESFPDDGTATWIWVGPSEREPTLMEINDDGEIIAPTDGDATVDEDGPGVSRETDGRFAPGGRGPIKE